MGPASWNAVKIILVAGTPIQRLFSGIGETHLFCNRQAVKIIKKDGNPAYARILNNYLEFINRGVIWADKGWKNFSHYYNPEADNGLGPWPDARFECRFLFEKALLHWRKGNKRKSFFYIGAASHLVQDLCVPHHAKGIAFCGHREYEKWVQDNYLEFSVGSGGIYNDCFEPCAWIEFNANISRKYFPYVASIGSITSYNMATEILLPLAQRSTAGFLSSFLDYVNSKRELECPVY